MGWDMGQDSDTQVVIYPDATGPSSKETYVEELLFGMDSPLEEDSPIIFPGSFNPIHDGHIAICEAALEQFGKPVWLEMSISNTHKLPMDAISLRERICKIHDVVSDAIAGVIITNHPRFSEKTALFKGSGRPHFIIGADTHNRLDCFEYDALYINANFVVAERKGSKLIDIDYQYKHGLPFAGFISLEHYTDQGQSSTEIRKGGTRCQ